MQAQCSSDGVILSTSSGSFSSPNYPSNYPNSRTCRWIIVVQDGYRIQLTFQTFLLETCLVPSICSCDHVEIRDGSDGNSPRFGRFCANNKPSPIHSSGRSLWIEFDSDFTTKERGFFATYTTIGMILLLLSQSFEALIHIADCSSVSLRKKSVTKFTRLLSNFIAIFQITNFVNRSTRNILGDGKNPSSKKENFEVKLLVVCPLLR